MKRKSLSKLGNIIILAFVLQAISINLIAGEIKIVGDSISSDKQGNTIYQVETNGINTAYKIIGSGESLLMIMGLGGTMDNWPQQVIDSLSKEFQLIIFDNRGMGLTSDNGIEFSLELFASDVIALAISVYGCQ